MRIGKNNVDVEVRRLMLSYLNGIQVIIVIILFFIVLFIIILFIVILFIVILFIVTLFIVTLFIVIMFNNLKSIMRKLSFGRQSICWAPLENRLTSPS